MKELKQAAERQREALQTEAELERADLRRRLREAEIRAGQLDDEHRRELSELSDQIKATLQREREEKRRLHFENAHLQTKLHDLNQQLAADFHQ